MKEYKIAKGWAIFMYLTAPLLIGLFGGLLIHSFTKETSLDNADWILIPVCIPMTILMIVGVIDTYKSKLIIHNHSIVSISVFSKRELQFDEIKGFTVNDNYIFIEPVETNKKRIRISKYIGGYHDVLSWLANNFTDLDVQTGIEEEQAILNDESYGWSKDSREEKLVKARRTAKIINWAGGITAAWVLFYPSPYEYALLMAAAVPLVAILAVKLSRGLIRLDEKKSSAYPSVIYALIYPSLALVIRVLDYQIFNYSNVWRNTILLTLSLLAFLLLKQKEITFKKKSDYLTVAGVASFLFAYSFGAVIFFNCYYDVSNAEYFTAKVLNKRISSGKTTTRYLELSAWGQQKEVDEVSVGKGLYNRTEVGSTVKIYFRNGTLGIPWFIVE
jgi:hypothetical protein